MFEECAGSQLRRVSKYERRGGGGGGGGGGVLPLAIDQIRARGVGVGNVR